MTQGRPKNQHGFNNFQKLFFCIVVFDGKKGTENDLVFVSYITLTIIHSQDMTHLTKQLSKMPPGPA